MTEPYKTIPIGKNMPKYGVPPAVVLINPKYARNVGVVVRAASCYGYGQVWFTGERVAMDIENRKRLPREERLKGYKEVEIIQNDKPFDQFPQGVTPVAIEVRPGSENLFEFEHPENPVYVFGPEDGSIPGTMLRHCHRFVVIPTRHCLNLATAVCTVLYDRAFKQYLNGETGIITPGEWEERGAQIKNFDDLNVVAGK